MHGSIWNCSISLAYFSFHKGYPGLVSATLVPIFGEKSMKGPIGGAIDVLAVIATVTGVAATRIWCTSNK